MRWQALRARQGRADIFDTVAVNLLIVAINAATGILTARLFGAEGRGQYAAMILWPQFLAMTLTLGVPTSLIYHIKRSPDQARELFSAAVLLGLGTGAVAAIAGVVAIPWSMRQYEPETIQFAQWTMFLMPVAALTEVSIGAFRGREAFRLYNRLRLLTPVLTLAGFIILGLAGEMTPAYAAVSTLAACSFVGGWFTLHHLRHWRPRVSGARDGLDRLLSYGARVWGNDLLVNLSSQIDSLLVVGLLSPAQMGMYTVALSLSRMLNVFQAAIVNVLFPRIAGRPAEEAIHAAARAARAGTMVAIAAGLGLLLFAEPLLRLLYGAEFTAAIPVLRILLLETILTGATVILFQPFLALEKPGLVSLIQGLGLAASVPLMLFLIPRMGLAGAATALLIVAAGRLTLTMLGYPILLRRRAPAPA